MSGLLTPKQAAQQLGVSRAYLYRAVEAGLLPAVWLPVTNKKTLQLMRQGHEPRKALRIRPEDLQAFLSAHRTP